VVSFGIHRSRVEDRVKGIREGDQMNKGYWVVAYRKVHDQATVKNYAAAACTGAGEVWGTHVGVADERGLRLWRLGSKQMTVVVEFDRYEIALAAYESDDHKKALAALGPSVERDFRIAEGV